MITNKTKTYNQITLSESKQHLGYDTGDTTNDVYLIHLINTSTNIAEAEIGFDIAVTSNSLEDYDFLGSEYILHCKQPRSITMSGITQNNAVVNLTALITPQYFENYTNLILGQYYDFKKVLVSYNCGYTVLPENLKHAILLKIAELNDIDRSNYISNTQINSKAFERLISQYKRLI
jgi:hypothetical protein